MCCSPWGHKELDWTTEQQHVARQRFYTVTRTKAQPLVEDAHTWQRTPDTKLTNVIEHVKHAHTFESSQLEGFYVGDLLCSQRQTWVQATIYQKETLGKCIYLLSLRFLDRDNG